MIFKSNNLRVLCPKVLHTINLDTIFIVILINFSNLNFKTHCSFFSTTHTVIMWCIYIGCYSNNVGVNTLTQFLSLSPICYNCECRELAVWREVTENKTFAHCLSTLWHKVTVLKSHSILNDEGLKHTSEKSNMNLISNAPQILFAKSKKNVPMFSVAQST